ncbi:MAG TPA: DUF4065 domain-containing protein [Methylomusa anaerophila]|uniref:HTH cro/C1-type domain-containing protein n=1 Tax=Methylomusa anaerophila TaxID=1930071 RepID=A0A348AMM4_9FIRM|nr:type II TA system antitoxin MqsA family protein [Methylomusa anaerophila]BBB92322.1 hypothetical protein MAMMFC1_03015 [Methylomusa anaerophila]HML90038.1 DUF4065 domain-containing protein [Methylomusa anaerophila]
MSNPIIFCPHCLEERAYHTIEKKEVYPVKGEPVEITATVAVCDACGEEIFQPDLDNANLLLAYDVYRRKHKLLFPAEIKSIREKYGLSQRKFAKLLGWGEITVHRYEAGALQDIAHNDVLKLLQDPLNMQRLLEQRQSELDEKEYKKLAGTVRDALEQTKKERLRDCIVMNYFNNESNIYTGNRPFDLDKFAAMILFFAGVMSGMLYKTMMWKLLWYADMVHFRRHDRSISGAHYAHLPYGPVPDEHDLLLSQLRSEGIIDVTPQIRGETIKGKVDLSANAFTPEEMDTLTHIAKTFQKFNTRRISEYSHKEKGYMETQDGQYISYAYTKELSLQ